MGKENILVVDDEDSVRHLLGRLLKMNKYQCILAANAEEARKVLLDQNIDLILCDVKMPGESGMDFIRFVNAKYPNIAVLMVTAIDDSETAKEALKIGVYGYMIKPFKTSEVLINIANALRRRELEIHNRLQRENLEKMVQERTYALQNALRDLQQVLKSTIQAMALAVESRDPYTAGHQRRVADLAHAIAKEIGLPENVIEGVRMAGIIHDLGKISIPAEILSKPVKLTDIEFSLIKTHPQVGYEILKGIAFPWPIAKVMIQHHERMNGDGYPRGISGDDIVIEARIIGVADVVEAMASHRPYRPALGIDKALEEISNNKGILYDSDVVDACTKLFCDKGFKF
jgi:putative nucleotidyltransferase with HDIG domain